MCGGGGFDTALCCTDEAQKGVGGGFPRGTWYDTVNCIFSCTVFKAAVIIPRAAMLHAFWAVGMPTGTVSD